MKNRYSSLSELSGIKGSIEYTVTINAPSLKGGRLVGFGYDIVYQIEDQRLSITCNGV
jgi:hypothetical protein